jgi:hypothetical protein
MRARPLADDLDIDNATFPSRPMLVLFARVRRESLRSWERVPFDGGGVDLTRATAARGRRGVTSSVSREGTLVCRHGAGDASIAEPSWLGTLTASSAAQGSGQTFLDALDCHDARRAVRSRGRAARALA